MLKHKCTVLTSKDKCPAKMEDRGVISLLYNNKDLAKSGFDIVGPYDDEWSFVKGKLCCDKDGAYDYLPNGATFFTGYKCPTNTKDLGSAGLFFDWEDKKRRDQNEPLGFPFPYGGRALNSIWVFPKLCKVNEDTKLDEKMYLHAPTCGVFWKDYGKSGIMYNAMKAENSCPFTYDLLQPFSSEWYVSRPKLCQWNPTQDSKLYDCMTAGRSVECDNIMIDYCKRGENRENPECSCLQSKVMTLGAPVCIDKKCIEKGYKTTGMVAEKCDETTHPIPCQSYFKIKEECPNVELEYNQYTEACLNPPPDHNVKTIDPRIAQMKEMIRKRHEKVLYDQRVKMMMLFLFAMIGFYILARIIDYYLERRLDKKETIFNIDLKERMNSK